MKKAEISLAGQKEPQSSLLLSAMNTDSQIGHCFNALLSLLFFYYLHSRQVSFLKTKRLQWTGSFSSSNTHADCSDVQPKHCPENFVKQNITTLPDNLEKSVGWSRLLPTMHRWSEYGLQMLRRLYQGDTAEGKTKIFSLLLLYTCAHTHSLHAIRTTGKLSVFSILHLLKTFYKATRRIF